MDTHLNMSDCQLGSPGDVIMVVVYFNELGDISTHRDDISTR